LLWNYNFRLAETSSWFNFTLFYESLHISSSTKLHYYRNWLNPPSQKAYVLHTSDGTNWISVGIRNRNESERLEKSESESFGINLKIEKRNRNTERNGISQKSGIGIRNGMELSQKPGIFRNSESEYIKKFFTNFSHPLI